MAHRDGTRLVEAWQDENKVYHFEGSTRNLEKLVRAIGYDDLDYFLSDNPGAQEAIVDFICEWTNRNTEWRENLEAELPPAAREPEEDEDEFHESCVICQNERHDINERPHVMEGQE